MILTILNDSPLTIQKIELPLYLTLCYYINADFHLEVHMFQGLCLKRVVIFKGDRNYWKSQEACSKGPARH